MRACTRDLGIYRQLGGFLRVERVANEMRVERVANEMRVERVDEEMMCIRIVCK